MTNVPAGAAAAADFKQLQPDDPQHLRLAFELEGLTEIVGSRHEREIVAFFAEAGHAWVTDDETAWCAAFAHAILGRAGIDGTGALNARSYLQWGVVTEKPRRGDVVVFKRGKSSWQGHVAFYLGEDARKIWVIGGNQGNAVSVAGYAKSSLLGFRRVPGASRETPEGEVEAPQPRPAEERPASRETVMWVQEKLRALGYAEVGAADGIVGTLTRGAILAFRADNGLPLVPAIDADLHTALLAAAPRSMSTERTEAKPKEVREQVPEAKANWWQMIVGFFAALGSAVTGFFSFLGDRFEEVRGFVQPAFELFGAVPLWAYAGLFLAAGLFLYLNGRKGQQASVDAVRTGARR